MENIKAQYWKYSLIILILFIAVVLFRELAPFMSGVLGASTIYVMVRGQMRYLTQKKNWGRALSAILIVIEAILCFLIPISVAVWLLVGELNNINLDPSSYISGIQHFNELIQQKTGYNVLSSENLISAASYLPKIGQILLDSVSSSLCFILC